MAYEPGKATIAELDAELRMLRRMRNSGVLETTSAEGQQVRYRSMADLDQVYKRVERELSAAVEASGGTTRKNRTRRIIVLR